MATRKQKRQDDTRQTSVAEAIAIGTAAGGLVLGTIQAQGNQPDSEQSPAHAEALGVADTEASADHRGETSLPEAHPVAAEPQAPAAQLNDAAQPSPIPTEQPADASSPVAAGEAGIPDGAAADTVTLPNTVPAPVQSQLAIELSEQMTATLVKVIGSVEPGQSPADIGQSLADNIIASAQQIVAKLDIGALLAETEGLADGIVAAVDAPSIAADVLGATSGIADSVLADVSDLPKTILGELNLNETVALLMDVPSSLLGNDGPDSPGGMLSELFYADGDSDSLAIPDLSSAAGTLVSDIGSVTGILGLSYTDAPDHQGGHGLNALSLL